MNRASSRPAILAAAVLLAAGQAGLLWAAELPTFRKGVWEFRRTIDSGAPGAKPNVLTRKECTDPSADMKRQREQLAKLGCTFSAVTASGDAYAFDSECPMQGVVMRSKSLLTPKGDSAYTIQVTSTGGGQSSKELLEARRVGDC